MKPQQQIVDALTTYKQREQEDGTLHELRVLCDTNGVSRLIGVPVRVVASILLLWSGTSKDHQRCQACCVGREGWLPWMWKRLTMMNAAELAD